MAHLKSMIEKGLKDMKVSRLADDQIAPPSSDVEYPWGLRLDLNKKALDTLNLDIKKLAVGTEVCLECRAEVISIRQNKSGHENTENLELQITHLGFEEEED